jgi:Domain of unknown function (DUF4386)
MRSTSIESRTQFYARTGGALYLVLIVLGFFAVAIRGKVFVAGNAASTAAHLISMQPLWRWGIAAEFVALAATISLAMIYYYLFRPVHKELNLLATLLRMVGITVQAVALLNLLEALTPLGSAAYLKAFAPEQLHALAYQAIGAHARGFGLALLLFGWCFLVHGWLIYRSGFLPRALGVMIQIAGLCYLTNSFALFLAPPLEDRLFPWILLPCFVAESSLCLWLLIKGVNVEKWRKLSAEMLRV